MIELGPGEKLVIIGGNAAEAVRWARECGLNPWQVIPITYVSQLRGLPTGIKYALIGSWAQRRDWPELDNTLCARQARQVW